MSTPETPVQDAIEHLYAVLGQAIQRRRNFCAETSASPPAAAQVTEAAMAIAELGKVQYP